MLPMALRFVTCLALCTCVSAFVPASRVAERILVEKKILKKAGTPVHVGKPARAQRVLCMEPAERTVKLDEDTVKEVAAAASGDEQQQRIDAALAELARSGDRASAAAAGGFANSSPSEIGEGAEGVPAWLSVAPIVVGGFSVALFVLNAYGVFGEGPDLSTLVG